MLLCIPTSRERRFTAIAARFTSVSATQTVGSPQQALEKLLAELNQKTNEAIRKSELEELGVSHNPVLAITVQQGNPPSYLGTVSITYYVSDDDLPESEKAMRREIARALSGPPERHGEPDWPDEDFSAFYNED